MKWSNCAVEDLKRYNFLKQSIINIEERIEILATSYLGMKTSITDGIPASGSGSKREDNMLSNIAERKRLKHLLRTNKRMVELIEKGLSELSEAEKTVLYNFFIIKKKGHVEATMSELNIERSHVYRLKEEALEKFTRAMFGIAEL